MNRIIKRMWYEAKYERRNMVHVFPSGYGCVIGVAKDDAICRYDSLCAEYFRISYQHLMRSFFNHNILIPSHPL